jgi:hypothetical protein
MAPVHGKQGALRLERGNRLLQDPLQVVIPEVVQELGEHNEVEATGRPAAGQLALEQPGSKALRYRAARNNARLTAYLRCSYQRSSKPHGSAAAWYMASK